jgi:hypothetical protein
LLDQAAAQLGYWASLERSAKAESLQQANVPTAQLALFLQARQSFRKDDAIMT